MMKAEEAKREGKNENGGGGNGGKANSFPFITILLTGTSCATYYCWNKWDFKRCTREFVFSETNFYNMKKY